MRVTWRLRIIRRKIVSTAHTKAETMRAAWRIYCVTAIPFIAGGGFLAAREMAVQELRSCEGDNYVSQTGSAIVVGCAGLVLGAIAGAVYPVTLPILVHFYRESKQSLYKRHQ